MPDAERLTIVPGFWKPLLSSTLAIFGSGVDPEGWFGGDVGERSVERQGGNAKGEVAREI
jgi:hypothetical protein